MSLTLRIDPHTLNRAEERGATEAEIRDVWESGEPTPAKRNRLAKVKVFPFGRQWNNRFYEEKRVEVIYVVEDGVWITVTVYVYFGRWTLQE